MFAANPFNDPIELKNKLMPPLERAITDASPTLRTTFKKLMEPSPSEATITAVSGAIHGLLPLPLRLAVSKQSLAQFLKDNHELVREAVRRLPD